MKFTWNKKGMVFDIRVNKMPKWASGSLLQPTPILIDNGEVIRIFVGMRDTLGQSRIGYVDVSSKNPGEIIRISEDYVLDVGNDGCFDDSGVVPASIINDAGQYKMFYAGYSLLSKVRFSVLAGLAYGNAADIEVHFNRYKKVPVFERTHEHTLFRVPHTVLKEDNIYKIWYGGGDHFIKFNDYTYPVYDIYYCETDNLLKIPESSSKVLTFANADEYRVARPYVVKFDKIYGMFLCVATKTKGYRLGYAESYDGLIWNRCDSNLNLYPSENSWDSDMMGYPSFVQTKYGSYLFYNGNEYGKYGFGYSELVQLAHD
ncbi:MAG: hypothetical protein K0R14_1373 [Burkholderiales bacterium]|jgi:hypothetical protein|nr:hypothetical protein [Burkholderiales bacterium]